MASDELYDSCLHILKDETIEEEDKTEKLEDLVKDKSGLHGKALEATVLDILWRFRNAATSTPSSPAIRHTVLRRTSPAPWQQASSRSGTPLNSSPRSATASPTPSIGMGARPSLFRMKSAGSPFASPRPSPKFGQSSLQAPHSPGLGGPEVYSSVSTPDVYSDIGSDGFSWFVSDDGTSATSSGYGRDVTGAHEWTPSQMFEMSPYDIIRSVLRDERPDEEIETALEAHGYDLGATIASFMETANPFDGSQAAAGTPESRTYLVGKSMSTGSRPATPAGQAKSPIVCRYWLSTGQCLRADCRFSHDLSSHVCKYWLAGNCLAGDSCIFSHDPSNLLSSMSLNNAQYAGTPTTEAAQPIYQTEDLQGFPVLQGSQPSPNTESSLRSLYASQETVAPPPGFSSRGALAPEFIPSSQAHSHPSSRHQSPARKSPNPAPDNEEAFPSLGSAALRGGKKHHGKRGHGHGHKDKESNPGSLADVVRMSSPANHSNTGQSPRRTLRGRGSYSGSRENSSAAQAIPAPEHIPWLETGERANKAYLKARQEAIRHGGARNKFLQSAAQAWNRNDVRAAKALSLRGQSENDLMREAHREAARALFEERNKHRAQAHPAAAAAAAAARNEEADEVFVDLHGLHPAEAVSYLAAALTSQRSAAALDRDASPYLYAIVGTGHHSRNGRDKVGKAVRAYLCECRYAFKEFGAPNDSARAAGAPAAGGILGIAVASGDLSAIGRGTGASTAADLGGAGGSVDFDDDEAAAHRDDSTTPTRKPMQHGKIRILKAEDVLRESGGNSS